MSAADFILAGMVGIGGGVALYDFLKAKGYSGDDIVELLNKNPVAAKEFVNNLDPEVKVISGKRDIKNIMKVVREEHSPISANAAEIQFNDAVHGGNNAYMYPGKKDFYIISSKKVNPLVLEHELGHVKDFRSIKDRGEDHTEAYGGNSVIRNLGRLLSKSVYDKDIIGREQAAWDNVQTKSEERDKLQEEAMKTYHKNFHKNRGVLAGFSAGSVLGGMLGSKYAPAATPLLMTAGGVLGTLPAALV